MFGRNLKTWKRGLLIGLIPLALAILSSLILMIKPPAMGIFALNLIMILPLFYLFSFVFLFLAILIGLIIHKSWPIKILVLLIPILIFTSVTIYAYSAEPPSGEIKTYKGIWSPAFPMTAKMLLFDIEQLKEDGVNTLSFGPNYFTDEEGNIHSVPFMKQLMILFIQVAHRNGFRVFLVADMWAPGFAGKIENKDLFFEQATAISLEWAEIAEKYKVEMYAPSNEPAIIIDDDQEALDQWTYNIAQKIKEKYHGLLIYKASSHGDFDNDYRGYDYVGLDIFPTTDQTLEEFKNELQNHLENCLEFAQRDKTKGIILSEIGVQVKVTIKGDISSTTDKPFSLDYQKQAYEMFFVEGQDKVIGYIFCCWESEFGPNNLPAEQVMKEWFHKIN